MEIIAVKSAGENKLKQCSLAQSQKQAEAEAPELSVNYAQN